MKFDKLGWIVAAGLAGGMVGAGFQGATQKIGSVDIGRVFSDSDYVKTQQNQLKTEQDTRTAVMQFISQNKAMKPEDAQRYAQLGVKTSPSAAEKTELDRITQDARAASARQRDLSLKTPTDADQKEITEFASRSTANTQMLQQLAAGYDQDLRDLQDKLRNATLSKVRDAVKDVAGKQGFTIVFAQEVAPYAANDLTADSLAQMNKKK